MLGELDDGGLVDNHKIDILSAHGLSVTASGLAVLAAFQRNRGVEAGLGHLDDGGEVLEHLAGLIGVHILHQTQQRRRDEQVTLSQRNLVLVQLVVARADGGNNSQTVSQLGASGNLRDALLTSVAGEAESVLLGGDLRTDELAGQVCHRHLRRLDVVHSVNVEHTTTVVVTLDGLVLEGDVALNVAGVAGIVTQTLHVQHGDDELASIGALADQLGVAVQHGGHGRLLIHSVQHKCLCDFDNIRHSLHFSFQNLVTSFRSRHQPQP